MWMLFVAGLLTGFHCLTMCGNLVVGYSLRSGRTVTVWHHVVYNAARVASYALTGALLGLLGQAVNVAAFGGTATLAGGIFLVFLALKMFGLFTGTKLPALPGIAAFRQFVGSLAGRARALTKTSGASYLPEAALGSLSGFMPCAPLQAAQIYAAGTGSPVAGALAMLAFGLGTVPMLFAYGFVAGRLTVSFRANMARVFAVVVLILGLVLLDRGLTLVNSPITAAKVVGYVKQAVAPSDAVAPGGTVVLTIENTRYVPAEVRVPAGRPVTIEVRRNEDSPCSNELWIPALGVRQPLAPFGVTRIELPPLEAGIYQMTCQMGMMDGRLVVGDVSGTSRLYVGLGLLALGLLGLLHLQRTKPAVARTGTNTGKKKGASE